MLLFRLLILFGTYYYFYHYLGIQTLDQLETFTFTKLDELKVLLFDLMEQTIEQKLKALYSLQTLHTQIDKIRQVRGELPIEVADLENEITGLETRIQKIKAELDELEDAIVTRKNNIKY